MLEKRCEENKIKNARLLDYLLCRGSVHALPPPSVANEGPLLGVVAVSLRPDLREVHERSIRLIKIFMFTF